MELAANQKAKSVTPKELLGKHLNSAISRRPNITARLKTVFAAAFQSERERIATKETSFCK